jgi:hypothetical protein
MRAPGTVCGENKPNWARRSAKPLTKQLRHTGAAILNQLHEKQGDGREENSVDVPTLVQQKLKDEPDYEQNSAYYPKGFQEDSHVGN